MTTDAQEESGTEVRQTGTVIQRIRGHAVLIVIAFLCAVPIYWLFATSLRRPEDIYSLSPFPWPLSIENYTDAAAKVDILGLLLSPCELFNLLFKGSLQFGFALRGGVPQLLLVGNVRLEVCDDPFRLFDLGVVNMHGFLSSCLRIRHFALQL